VPPLNNEALLATDSSNGFTRLFQHERRERAALLDEACAGDESMPKQVAGILAPQGWNNQVFRSEALVHN
jgi:hypothetical protein